MTKKTYDVKAKGIIGLAMSIEAESQEQAEALAKALKQDKSELNKTKRLKPRR